MAGGFSSGFSGGFGPLEFVRRDRRTTLHKTIKFNHRRKQMSSMILQGASASGLYTGKPGIYMSVDAIQFDIPLSGVATACSVTLSGQYGTKYTFNDNINPTINFKPNEDVYVTTTNFIASYGVIINYTEGGDMSSYMQYDTARNPAVQGTETFWRYRT